MVFCNGKGVIENCNIYDNYYYKFLNPDYPNDKINGLGAKKNVDYNYMNSSGALYVGSADVVVRNCSITGNANVYGGGVGVLNAESDSDIKFIGCVIANNKAELCGGAIYARSQTGQHISFIDCAIYDNEAPKGGILYATTLVPDNNKYWGGLVEFLFCTFANNKDEDNGSFGFYDLYMPRIPWAIELKGCQIIGDTPYNAADCYNYVATKSLAISEEAFESDDFADIATTGLFPKDGSLADITVTSDTYAEWSEFFTGATLTRKSGASTFKINFAERLVAEPDEDSGGENNEPEKDSGDKEETGKEEPTAVEPVTDAEPSGEVEKPGKGFPYWVIVFPALGLIACSITVGVLVSKKKSLRKQAAPEISQEEALEGIIEEEPKAMADFSSYSTEELAKLIASRLPGANLTPKELQIAALMLTSERRKEIADRLVVSEDTVKTHISHIFKKVGVSSKSELKSLINRLI